MAPATLPTEPELEAPRRERPEPLWVGMPGVCAGSTHHRAGFFGFFRRDFSKMARARVSCPIFSSSRDSKSHRGVEWGHFFNCGQKGQTSKRGRAWAGVPEDRESRGCSSAQQSGAARGHGDHPRHGPAELRMCTTGASVFLCTRVHRACSHAQLCGAHSGWDPGAVRPKGPQGSGVGNGQEGPEEKHCSE